MTVKILCSVWFVAAASAGFAQVAVTVTPNTATLHIGNQRDFTARVTGSSNTGIAWLVNGVRGGNAAVGFMAANGRYTPPATLPEPNTVTLTAQHAESGTTSAGVTVTLLNPFPELASVHPFRVRTGPFTLVINGSGFVRGSRVSLAGTPLRTTYVSPTRLTASGSILSSQKGYVPVFVHNPEPGISSSTPIFMEINPQAGNCGEVSEAAAARFLEQAAFGADPDTLAEVRCAGPERWIEEQFDTPASGYPDPARLGLGLGPVQARFFSNAVHGKDQLRQRVAFALAQIWVVSGSVANFPHKLIPYLHLLHKHAFGNYRDLMRDVTLSPAMGDYLNMVNNEKANPARGTLANENYAREILQLFTVGLWMLNRDGTVQTDSEGKPVPAYTQKDILEFAKVFTGWTYPTQPGEPRRARNPAYYFGPMEPWEANHDTSRKTLLGGMVLAAGQSAEQDLEAALDSLFYHSNMGPFVCKNLIQHLVKSNPSRAYVQRVVEAWEDNGAGERGDLRAVVKTILMHEEARRGDTPGEPSVDDGHLREPVLWMAGMLRALGAMVNDTNGLAGRGAALGQNIHFPPTVFNYYVPGYEIPGSSLLGPEFQIHSQSTALDRANLVNALIYGSLGGGVTVDISPWVFLAYSPNTLVDRLDTVFLHGQMPPRLRQLLLDAIDQIPGERAKAQAALYLVLSSGYYAVQH